MGFDITLPNINAQTEEGRVRQICTYLHQLVQQLNWAINTIDQGGSANVAYKRGTSTVSDMTEEQAESTFNAIKSLIINSADIVTAYSTKLSERYSGMYVAGSDFGRFVEQTGQTLEKTSVSLESLYSNIQQIFSDIDTLEDTIVYVTARIRTGLLEYDDNGVPIYGLEVGQKNTIDGVETFNKYARFTADKLSFYDQNGTEMGYISDHKLYIDNIEVLVSIKRGGLKEIILPNGDTVEKWVGRG